jgi:hypothetical protein
MELKMFTKDPERMMGNGSLLKQQWNASWDEKETKTPGPHDSFKETTPLPSDHAFLPPEKASGRRWPFPPAFPHCIVPPSTQASFFDITPCLFQLAAAMESSPGQI